MQEPNWENLAQPDGIPCYLHPFLISTFIRKVPVSDASKYRLFLLPWVTHSHFPELWVV